MQQILTTENISVKYDKRSEHSELKGVSIAFKKGEITAIVGPNGSGKSTLVKALSRVEQPSQGCVIVDDRDLYSNLTAKGAAQLIGVVPQDTTVSFDFTSREIVAMGLAPYRTGWSHYLGESFEDQVRIDDALEKASLSADLSTRPVMTLSGGERQRALIARALVQRAEVVILDEPTASLDLSHQTHLFGQLLELAKTQNKAVVVVLHDLNIAAQYAQRIILLRDGLVAADGSPVDVLLPGLIEKVYNVRVAVTTDHATGHLRVTVLGKPESQQLAGKNIYVIGGGGGASHLVRLLTAAGALVKAGYLHKGDLDLETADLCKVESSILEPFQTVPALTRQEIQEIASSFDLVIFSPAAIGPSNEQIIEDVLSICRLGAPVIILDSINDTINHKIGKISANKLEFWFELKQEQSCYIVHFENILAAVMLKSKNA